jgi:hypothetical protein
MSSAYDMFMLSGIEGVLDEYVNEDEVELFTAEEVAAFDVLRGLTKIVGQIVYFERPANAVNIKTKIGSNWVPGTKNATYDYMLILKDWQTGKGFVIFVAPKMATINLAVPKTVWLGATVVVFDAKMAGQYRGLPALSTDHLILPIAFNGTQLKIGSRIVDGSLRKPFVLRDKDAGFHTFHGLGVADLKILPGAFFKIACRKYGCDGSHQGLACPSPTNYNQNGNMAMIGSILVPSLNLINGKAEFHLRSTARLFLSDEAYTNGKVPRISMAKVHCAVNDCLAYYDQKLCTWDIAGWSNSEGDNATEIDAGNVKQHVTVLKLHYGFKDWKDEDCAAKMEEIIINNPFRIKVVDEHLYDPQPSVPISGSGRRGSGGGGHGSGGGGRGSGGGGGGRGSGGGLGGSGGGGDDQGGGSGSGSGGGGDDQGGGYGSSTGGGITGSSRHSSFPTSGSSRERSADVRGHSSGSGNNQNMPSKRRRPNDHKERTQIASDSPSSSPGSWSINASRGGGIPSLNSLSEGYGSDSIEEVNRMHNIRQYRFGAPGVNLEPDGSSLVGNAPDVSSLNNATKRYMQSEDVQRTLKELADQRGIVCLFCHGLYFIYVIYFKREKERTTRKEICLKKKWKKRITVVLLLLRL